VGGAGWPVGLGGVGGQQDFEPQLGCEFCGFWPVFPVAVVSPGGARASSGRSVFLFALDSFVVLDSFDSSALAVVVVSPRWFVW
jgi:hypothetical protein